MGRFSSQLPRSESFNVQCCVKEGDAVEGRQPSEVQCRVVKKEPESTTGTSLTLEFGMNEEVKLRERDEFTTLECSVACTRVYPVLCEIGRLDGKEISASGDCGACWVCMEPGGSYHKCIIGLHVGGITEKGTYAVPLPPDWLES
jgi:hypothetical protein